jgi:AraC-like DNA-binding protein
VCGGPGWWPIFTGHSLVPFEVEHGVEAERWDYNQRSIALAVEGKRTVLGEHAGFRDYFVPVIAKGEVVAVLVAGSFALARPTAAAVVEHWHRMTGRQADPAEPGFAAYLRTVLSLLVLEGDRLRSFVRLLELLAKLLAGAGRADELLNRATRLRAKLGPARFVDGVWDTARQMVDERWSQGHFSGARALELRNMGLARAPDQVLVGLARAKAKGRDPVEEAVARDELQRATVDLARAAGDAIAGQVGDHGVMFLCAIKGTAQTKRQRLVALGDKAASLAERRFGLTLHLGVSLGSGAQPIHRTYQHALGAAESALASGRKLVVADAATRRAPHALRVLRDDLGRGLETDPGSLPARFDRYLEMVAVQSGYRIDAARFELELFMERAADALLRSATLDARSMSALREGLDEASSEAVTVSELFEAYRRAIGDIVAAIGNPVVARRDRGLRGALDYVHQHYAEPLGLDKIARVAGFAPKYFSELFRKREKITFERYVLRLRIERAKQLLTGTDLTARRIAELSGLKTQQYFCRVFRRAVGTTPLEYRAERRPLSVAAAKSNHT